MSYPRAGAADPSGVRPLRRAGRYAADARSSADAARAAALMLGPPCDAAWSARPARPATACGKPGFAGLLHGIAPLRVPPAALGGPLRSLSPPTPASPGGHAAFGHAGGNRCISSSHRQAASPPARRRIAGRLRKGQPCCVVPPGAAATPSFRRHPTWETPDDARRVSPHPKPVRHPERQRTGTHME